MFTATLPPAPDNTRFQSAVGRELCTAHTIPRRAEADLAMFFFIAEHVVEGLF